VEAGVPSWNLPEKTIVSVGITFRRVKIMALEDHAQLLLFNMEKQTEKSSV
jgi:hypothetical protein